MNAPIDLNRLRVFVAVHDAGSFSLAADRLGVPRSTASRAIAALEASLGFELFTRTTRRVAITPEGARLFDRIAPTLAGLDAALTDLPQPEDEPAGTLRVTAIADLATAVLVEAVTRFTARWPKVSIDLHLTSTMVDLAREGFDLALRVQARTPRTSSLVARRVGSIAVHLYASPAYLTRRGAPRSAADLEDHVSIAFRGAAPLRPAHALPSRRFIGCDDMSFARELVRSGAGIGSLPTFLAQRDLDAGALVRVLPRLVVQTAAVYLVRPARKHVPRRVTLFRDLVLETLQQRPLAPAGGGADR